MRQSGSVIVNKLSPAFALAVFVGAIFFIEKEMGAHGFRSIAHALRVLPGNAIAAALAFAGLSYACLISCEKLALSMLGKALPVSRVARVSFTAYALGNAMGFSFATAPAVRGRMYKERLTTAEVLGVSAITGVSVMTSAAIAAGVGLLASGDEVARHFTFASPLVWRVVSAILISPALLWLGLAAMKPREMAIGGAQVTTPRLPVALLQVLFGALDWAAAAAVLFALLPDHGGWSFGAFLSVFVFSGILGAVSGAPAGVGVFEASILTLAPSGQHAPAAIAALLVYRLVYTLAPLALAAILLGFDIAPAPVRRATWRLRGAALDLAPQVFSVLAFSAGVILLLSSATPAVASRLHFLASVAPLVVVELSHFLASVTGALLLLVAAGLWRKQEGAFFASLLLLTLGAAFSILKGFDFEEALLLIVVALLLAPCRGAFRRKSSLLSGALTPSWLASVAGATAAAGWLGLFAYRHVEYSDQLWWTFLRDAEASRFLRAAAGVAILVTLASAWVLLSPPRSRWRGRPEKADLDEAATIIATAEGMRGDAHLAMLGDKDLLFSQSRKSFIMFRVVGKRWIAMSEPCGLANEKRALMWRFAELADEAGASPAFYAISDALLPDVAELGLAVRKIGETAVISLPDFSLDGKERASLRHARNRAERQGATFSVLPAGSAGRHWRDLQEISDAWLQNRSAGEKGFSLGRFDRAYLNRTPLAIVRQRGRIVAFANVWTTGDRREATADLMRYSEDAPKGVMDYLFVKLMEWARDRGYREFDLGMAPLAGLGVHRLAPSFSKLGAAVFEVGEGLYGFRGLRAYKQKFEPEWRPLYLAAPPGELMAFALLDVARVTSGGWRNLLFAKGKRVSSTAGAPQGATEIGERQEDEDGAAGVRRFQDAPDEQRRAGAYER